jgi:putative inorganic carbon (HCO3(-)) transporter
MATGKKKTWPLVSFISLGLCDVLTFSRGGYLGLFAMIVVGIYFFWGQLGEKYKGGALLAGVLLLATLIIPSPLSSRYFSSFNLGEGSNKGRLETWEKALNVVMERPLLGTGIGNYALAIKPTANYREPIYAHSTYLDIAAETGIANALLWIALLLTTISSFWIKARKDLIFSAGALSLICFSVHSLVETAIFSPTVLTLLMIILSLNTLEIPSEKVV